MLIFMAFTLSAQEAYWTHYNVIVAPQEVETVHKLMSDYFTANKQEGVTVSLWENHFNDSGNNFTHSIGFSGTLDALGAMYGRDGGDTWKLFLTQLNQHIKDGFNARTGTRESHNGDLDKDYPVQKYFIVHVEDGATWDKAFNKYASANHVAGTLNMMGNFTSGVSPDGENRWVINGFSDFKGALGGANAMRTDAEKATNDKAWKEFLDTNGVSHLVRSGTRVMMGKW